MQTLSSFVFRQPAQALVETALLLSTALLVAAGLADLWLYALSGARVREFAREAALVTVDAGSAEAARGAAERRVQELLATQRLTLDAAEVYLPVLDLRPGGLVGVRVAATHHFRFLFAAANRLPPGDGELRRLSSVAYAVVAPHRNFD